MTPHEILARCPLFRDFSETGLRIVASIATERRIPADTPIFEEGTPGDSLFVVRRGRVRIVLRGSDGQGRRIAGLGAGDSLGELALVCPDAPRLVSAVAETPVDVFEIGHRDFVRLQAEKPQACLKLVLAIAAAFGHRLSEGRETFRDLLVPVARR